MMSSTRVAAAPIYPDDTPARWRPQTAGGPQSPELEGTGNEDSENTPIWKNELLEGSLPEVYGSILVPSGGDVHWVRTMVQFIGPGSLIAVGYMDPGNWSTDLAGGSSFGYKLLFVILTSSLIAMFLQHLTIKMAYATGRDLAQACRDSYSSPMLIYVLWLVAEAAIIATDLAEVIGSAIALYLLFGIPIIAGVCITALDVMFILFMQNKRFEWMERLVFCLVATVTICFAVQLGFSNPNARDVMQGYIPTESIFTDQECLYVAIGIIGATVMPHNLFLHSSIVLTRKIGSDEASIQQAIRYSTWDSCVSLLVAMFVNSSILILAASVFNTNGYTDVATLQDAYVLLKPLLGEVAPKLFGVALLASGQSSTITGTLAGQIVMEGFVNWRISPVYRRLITRLIAIVPAIITVLVAGDHAVNDLLILSQVTLSYALPFGVFPLIHISSDRRRMGDFANPLYIKVIAYTVAGIIVALNCVLLVQQFSGA